VVGYDDIYFASALARSLTSVRQPRHELDRVAASLLVEECDDPEAHEHQLVMYAPELIVRETTGPVPTS
jgi:LacI family transcriptional regulator